MRSSDMYPGALVGAHREACYSPYSRASLSPHSTTSSGSPPPPEVFGAHAHSHMPRAADIDDDLSDSTRKSLDLLCRVFPTTKRHVLFLVLHGCGGDVVQAIDQLFSSRNNSSADRASAQSAIDLHPLQATTPANIPRGAEPTRFSAFTPRRISGLQSLPHFGHFRPSWADVTSQGLVTAPFPSVLPSLASAFGPHPGLPQSSGKPVMYSSWPFSPFTQDRPGDTDSR